jgi:hypothetical protein
VGLVFYCKGYADAAVSGGDGEGAHAVMDGADCYACSVYCALGFYAQAGVIGYLEGYAVETVCYEVTALGVECAVYLG